MPTEFPKLDPSDLHSHVRALETELGITPGFLEGLIKEADDWSFIIKLQALAEAAVTHLITNELGREQLRKLLARTPMDGQRGKLELAKELALLDTETIGFLRTIGKIRNRFAHNVTNVSLRIEDYVSAEPENERDSIWRSLTYFGTDETFELPNGNRISRVAFARQNPRLATWWSAMNLIAVIYIHRRTQAWLKEHEQEVRAHDRRMADTFRALLQLTMPKDQPPEASKGS